MTKAVAIGIDLGTSNSCVAAYFNGSLEVIPNDQGCRTTPSYVTYGGPVPLVGEVAHRQSPKKSKSTVFAFKRLMGRWFADPSIRGGIKLSPFDVVSDNNTPVVKITNNGESKTYTPEEISAEVLKKLKSNAEVYLKRHVTQAVVTVPAYFNDNQRLRTIDACKLAGLTPLALINDTTAAALAYSIDKDVFYSTDKRKILVFSLGGGSLEVAILEVLHGSYEVLAIRGNGHLGGEDFTNNLLNSLAKQFSDKTSVQIKKFDKVTVAKLRNASEEAKKRLNFDEETEVELLNIDKGTDFCTMVSRKLFDVVNSELFDACKSQIELALEDANLTSSDIEDVVMVGGGTRMPRIHEMLQKIFPGRIKKGINKDEALAVGAAIWAASLTLFLSTEFILKGRTPFAIGTKRADGTMEAVIKRNHLNPGVNIMKCSPQPSGQPITIAIYQSLNDVVADHEFVASTEFEVKSSKQVLRFETDCAYGLLKVSSYEEDTKANHQELTLKREHKTHTTQQYASSVLNASAMAHISPEKESNRLLAAHSFKILCSKMSIQIKQGEDVNVSNISNIEALNSLRESFEFLDNNPHATEEEIRDMKETLEIKYQGFTRSDLCPN